MTGREIINAATDVGFMLLRYGAEVSRVEQSVTFICKAYEVEDVDVFALHSALFVTVTDKGETFSTKIKRTYSPGSDLSKVDKLNALSRRICAEKLEYDEIKRCLAEIEGEKSYSRITLCIAASVSAVFFTLLFGGGLSDCICAGVIGLLLQFGIYYIDRLESNGFIRTTIGAIFSTLAAKCCVVLGLASNFDVVNIGVLMLLVPGLALTIGMRDFLASDFLSGMAKLAEALLTAVCIAIGVIFVIIIW